MSDRAGDSNTGGIIVGELYRIGKRLSGGSFGEVRSGKHIRTQEAVAIKLEKKDIPKPQLENEYKYYTILGCQDEGIPQVYYYGEIKGYRVLVMEALECSLDKLFNDCNKKFSLKTVLMIAIQIIHRLEYVHSKCLLYRDVKPENFMIGRSAVGRQNIIYIVDFGLAKEFVDSDTERHVPFHATKAGLVGTARYMSVHSLAGQTQGRRDDLEALAYMLIYFLKGSLPWVGLKAKTLYDVAMMIGQKKTEINLETLCEDIPEEFLSYIQYCRELGFFQYPNYKYLIKLFTDLMEQNGWEFDDVYDWSYIREVYQAKESCICLGLCRRCFALRLKIKKK